MGFMDKLKKPASDEYNDYDNESYYDELGGTSSGVSYGDESSSADSMADTTAYAVPQTSYVPPRQAQPTGNLSVSGSSLEMKVVRPEHFDSVTQIADHLLEKRTVVLNLENTSKETSRRLIDFLSGVAYSINGSLKKIASHAYIITPDNVDVGDAALKSSRKPQEEQPAAAPASMLDEFADQ